MTLFYVDDFQRYHNLLLSSSHLKAVLNDVLFGVSHKLHVVTDKVYV